MTISEPILVFSSRGSSASTVCLEHHQTITAFTEQMHHSSQLIGGQAGSLQKNTTEFNVSSLLSNERSDTLNYALTKRRSSSNASGSESAAY